MWNKVKHIDLAYLLISIVVASLVWFYVDVTVRPDTKVSVRNVEVVFVGEDELMEKGLMVSNTVPSTVSLSLTGSRAVVSQLNRNNITVKVDLASQIRQPGRHKLEYTISYPSSVNMTNVKVTRNVSSIEADVVKHSTKTIRIEGLFQGSIAPSYFNQENEFRVYPREITVEGEDSLVQTVDHAVVELDEVNLKHTWEGELPVRLVTEEGEVIDSTEITMSRDTVHCVYPISYYKDIALSVDLVSGGGATAENVEDLKLSPAAIRVSGTEEVLKDLHTISLGEIDLGEVVTGYDEKLDITLPYGVSNASSHQEAHLTFGLDEALVTKTISTKSISLKNVPSGRKATADGVAVEVQIRGPKDSMKLLREEYVSLVADLSSVNDGATGWMRVPARVRVKGMSDVGAMGSYTVAVKVE